MVYDGSWWRHQMDTFSALLVICAGNSPVTGEFPSQRPVTRSFNVFLDLCLERTGEYTIVRLLIWDAIGLIMTSLWCGTYHLNTAALNECGRWCKSTGVGLHLLCTASCGMLYNNSTFSKIVLIVPYPILGLKNQHSTTHPAGYPI